jgi:NAD(P)H-hydrate epimerase
MTRLTRAQVREIDRRAIEEYHIPGIVLMENAGRAVADVACEMMHGDCVGEALVLCGGGNNGGDGLAVARHLHNRGSEVLIQLTVDPQSLKGDALINYLIVEAMKIPIAPIDLEAIASTPAIVIADAIFGTGLEKPSRDPFAAIVEAVKKSRVPVLAIDLPSGLDCDTGKPLGACIEAIRTVTFVAEKAGFVNPESRRFTGEVIVGDIGCPRELIDQVVAARP